MSKKIFKFYFYTNSYQTRKIGPFPLAYHSVQVQSQINEKANIFFSFITFYQRNNF